MGHFSDLDVQEREKQLGEESNHIMLEDREKDAARRAHDASNRTITMQSKDNVWVWKKLIEDNGVDGKVSIERWGRDCDQLETTSLCEINATIDALATLVEDVAEHAEGPWALKVATQEEVSNWQKNHASTTRDWAAEQMNY